MKKVKVLSKKATSELRKQNLFRFTNKNEIHQGFKYSIGLNTDPNNLDEVGNCVAGGLYFFSGEPMNALENTDYLKPVFIRKVTIPDGEKVVQNENKYRARRIIVGKRTRLIDYILENKESIRIRVPLIKVADIFTRTLGVRRGYTMFLTKYALPDEIHECVGFPNALPHIMRLHPIATEIDFMRIYPSISKPGVIPYIERSLRAGALVNDLHSDRVTYLAAARPALFEKLIASAGRCFYPQSGTDMQRVCLANPRVFSALCKYHLNNAKEILFQIEQYMSIVPNKTIKRMQKEIDAHAK